MSIYIVVRHTDHTGNIPYKNVWRNENGSWQLLSIQTESFLADILKIDEIVYFHGFGKSYGDGTIFGSAKIESKSKIEANKNYLVKFKDW